MSEFSPIFIYLVISSLVSLIPLGLPFPFSSNSLTYPEKLTAYECGFDPSGDARSRFDIRFYLVSILFIIPDPEVIGTILLRFYIYFYLICTLILPWDVIKIDGSCQLTVELPLVEFIVHFGCLTILLLSFCVLGPFSELV